jgi:predicted transcriptional regulator
LDQAVGFDEVRWLRELTYKSQKAEMPEIVGAKLLTRGLIERKEGRFSLTARGRIALAKLG